MLRSAASDARYRRTTVTRVSEGLSANRTMPIRTAESRFGTGRDESAEFSTGCPSFLVVPIPG